ncbi:lactose/L-arabinose transport system permease protein [Kitasatospora sp. GP30]|uniref:carbohydrate ABC transporter permease n=1 Tax=Kitasatospora sp. GP30 TaxID=3035084 RepID=UPI000C706CEC|nr:sugar ABC transporter permease [Kitasatospora sp. GP30]MDH6143653.1 lactose/L-arabinose transport system permease protein [Kitasatospora sp. GP30]
MSLAVRERAEERGKRPARPAGTARRTGGGTARLAPYLFILPALALFAAFRLYPIGWSFVLSLYHTEGMTQTWTGLGNYQRLIHDPLFWKALGNTGLILVVQVPVMLCLALGLSVALNSALLRWKPLFRLGFFLPVVTGLVTYGLMMGALLNQDSGAVNWLLSLVGLPEVHWLTDPFWAKVSVMLALTWHYTGYNAVIYLARLQGIPDEHYEAAAVDGAGAWRRFWHITLPGLRPALLLTVVLSTIGTLQLFDEPFIMTGGGPDNATTTIGVYLYQTGFRYFDFGYASAIGYALVLIISVFGLIQVKLAKEED